MKFLLLAAFALLALSPLAAQTVGSPAPDFTMGGLSSPADAVTRDACLGDVVVIKIWGIT